MNHLRPRSIRMFNRSLKKILRREFIRREILMKVLNQQLCKVWTWIKIQSQKVILVMALIVLRDHNISLLRSNMIHLSWSKSLQQSLMQSWDKWKSITIKLIKFTDPQLPMYSFIFNLFSWIRIKNAQASNLQSFLCQTLKIKKHRGSLLDPLFQLSH